MLSFAKDGGGGGVELNTGQRIFEICWEKRRHCEASHGNSRAENEDRAKLRGAWSMGESNEPGGRGSLIFPPELLLFSLRSFYAVTKQQRAREPTFKLISRPSAHTIRMYLRSFVTFDIYGKAFATRTRPHEWFANDLQRFCTMFNRRFKVTRWEIAKLTVIKKRIESI